MSDEQMIRIYARENSTQRGNNSSAIAGTVASALKYLAKQSFGLGPENSGPRKQEWSQGIGTSQILDFLGEGVLKRSDIEQQLANLRASGAVASHDSARKKKAENGNKGNDKRWGGRTVTSGDSATKKTVVDAVASVGAQSSFQRPCADLPAQKASQASIISLRLPNASRRL